jgi:septal ring factor EnvC (AmiA/AmiB activator)
VNEKSKKRIMFILSIVFFPITILGFLLLVVPRAWESLVSARGPANCAKDRIGEAQRDLEVVEHAVARAREHHTELTRAVAASRTTTADLGSIVERTTAELEDAGRRVSGVRAELNSSIAWLDSILGTDHDSD